MGTEISKLIIIIKKQTDAVSLINQSMIPNAFWRFRREIVLEVSHVLALNLFILVITVFNVSMLYISWWLLCKEGVACNMTKIDEIEK